jgi:PAS domain S-box-containing protein
MDMHDVYKSAIEQSSFGYAYYRIELDRSGKPADYVYLDVNAAFERLTGFSRAFVAGKRVSQVLPHIYDDDFDWIGVYGAVALGGEEREFERFIAARGRWYRISVFSPERLYFITTFQDITAQKAAEESLLEQAIALSERVKEMRLIVRFSSLAQEEGISLAGLLSRTAAFIPEGFQRPSRTVARIRLWGQSYGPEAPAPGPIALGLGDGSHDYSLREEIRVFGEPCGDITVSLPAWMPSAGELAFLPEEESLLAMLSMNIARFVEKSEAEAERRRSEARFRRYVDDAPDGIFVVDEYGRYREVNPAACAMLGYGHDELLSLSIPQILAPDFIEEGLNAFAALKEHGKDSRELKLMAKDGRMLYVSLSSVALADGRYMSFCKDITVQKRAEDKRELFYRAINALDQAVVITDAEGRILELNWAFARLYGYGLEEALGQTPRVLNPGREVYRNMGYTDEEYTALFEDMWNAVKDPQRGTWEGVVINKRKDGALVWAKLHLNAVYDGSGRVQYLIGLPFDISESRKREQIDKVELYSTIASLAELRDSETGNHMRRVGILARLLAKNLDMPEKYCDDIGVFAPMHDIGKVGIMDSILLAERKLTPEEWAEMQKHTVLGYNIVKGKKELDMVAAITLRHHERFDGKGYPGGLAGEDIPFSARITALIDVYDALRSERPYKRAWSHADAVSEIQAYSGTHFDPRIVACFLSLEASFAAIYGELS